MRKFLVLFILALGLVFIPVASASASTKPSKACTTALNDAEQLTKLTTQYVQGVGSFFMSLQGSAARNGTSGITGATNFINDLSTYTKTLTALSDLITPRVTILVSDYNVSATKCRAGK